MIGLTTPTGQDPQQAVLCGYSALISFSCTRNVFIVLPLGIYLIRELNTYCLM
jgi:hypothetical protein